MFLYHSATTVLPLSSTQYLEGVSLSLALAGMELATETRLKFTEISLLLHPLPQVLGLKVAPLHQASLNFLYRTFLYSNPYYGLLWLCVSWGLELLMNIY